MFIGSVKRCKTGLRKVLRTPSTIATVKAAVNPSIWTSEIMCATKKTASVFARIEIIIFIFLL